MAECVGLLPEGAVQECLAEAVAGRQASVTRVYNPVPPLQLVTWADGQVTMRPLTERGKCAALVALRLQQDASHLTSDDVDRRLADYRQGMDEAAVRKREPTTINLLPLRVVTPDAPARREWPVVTSVECGLRRHDNRLAEAAAHLAKAEQAKEDGQAALRESRRTLARAQEERDFAERRWRRALRLRELAWKVLGAAVLLGAGNAAWSIALLAASWRQWAGTLAGGGIVLLALVLMGRWAPVMAASVCAGDSATGSGPGGPEGQG